METLIVNSVKDQTVFYSGSASVDGNAVVIETVVESAFNTTSVTIVLNIVTFKTFSTRDVVGVIGREVKRDTVVYVSITTILSTYCLDISVVIDSSANTRSVNVVSSFTFCTDYIVISSEHSGVIEFDSEVFAVSELVSDFLTSYSVVVVTF